MIKNNTGKDFNELAELYVESFHDTNDDGTLHNEERQNVITKKDGKRTVKKTIYQTYNAWKRAVKKIDPDAKFYGDKDIGGAKMKDVDGVEYSAEWDGEGEIIQILLNEGLFDRAASTIGAYKQNIGDRASNVKTAVKGIASAAKGEHISPIRKPDTTIQQNKTQRIVQRHIQKLEQDLSDLATDLVKMRIMDADTAEKLAKTAFNSIKTNPSVANLMGRHKRNIPPVE